MKNNQFTSQEQQVLENIMLQRRDVRGNNFTNQPITDEVLDKILAAATMAPSVGFSQPWEFVIIKNKKVKQQIGENFKAENEKAQKLFLDKKRNLYAKLKLEGILEAPINLAVFYKPSDAPVLGQTSIAEVGEYSVVCAVQNMWLMARALNVGIGWVSILNPNSVKEILNAPSENKLVAYLCIGYVKEFFDRPELERLQWDDRKSMENSVFRDSY
ncbi:MAG: 5,6-dimethylbenzimidazole synthase [Kangiellaceae bacterium]